MVCEYITPNWPAPKNVRACVTTRAGGHSTGHYAGLNLATHVGDADACVINNRRLLRDTLKLRREPKWLTQVHGNHVTRADMGETDVPADASVCFTPDFVCAILTADCIPVFFCDRAGTRIGMAHAGWRGLKAGILAATMAALNCPSHELMTWLGPAIGPRAFRVGDEVRSAFLPSDELCFLPDGRGAWMANLYLLARRHLERLGVGFIGGGEYCTYYDDKRFYSYRRSQITGRMASLIWLTK